MADLICIWHMFLHLVSDWRIQVAGVVVSH